MENGKISSEIGAKIISTTTSGGRNHHTKLLAAMLAASATTHMGVRDQDPEFRTHSGKGGIGGWQYGQQRTSGQGVPGAQKARKLRKAKKKMRQQSRKK